MTVDCRQITRHIDEMFDDAWSDPLRSAVQLHLGHCSACRRVVARAQGLRAALRNWPVPPPAPGFHERVLQKAAAHHAPRAVQHAWFGLALAASLVLGVAVGLLFDTTARQGDGWQEAILPIERPYNVNLAFESERDLRDVMLTVHLPAAVEVVGYPGQRELIWQTDLQAGSNRLTLPLIAHSQEGGALITLITHGVQHKVFTLLIEVQTPSEPVPDRPPLRS